MNRHSDGCNDLSLRPLPTFSPWPITGIFHYVKKGCPERGKDSWRGSISSFVSWLILCGEKINHDRELGSNRFPETSYKSLGLGVPVRQPLPQSNLTPSSSMKDTLIKVDAGWGGVGRGGTLPKSAWGSRKTEAAICSGDPCSLHVVM